MRPADSHLLLFRFPAQGVPLNRPGIPELQAQEAEEEEEEAAAAAAAAAAEAEEEDHDEEMNGSAGSGEDESRGDADSDDDRKKSFAKDAHTNAAATAANSVSVKDMGEQLGGAEMGRNSVRTAGVNLQQKLREAIAAKSAKRAHPGEKVRW